MKNLGIYDFIVENLAYQSYKASRALVKSKYNIRVGVLLTDFPLSPLSLPSHIIHHHPTTHRLLVHRNSSMNITD
jgi:hypothetical protein